MIKLKIREFTIKYATSKRRPNLTTWRKEKKIKTVQHCLEPTEINKIDGDDISSSLDTTQEKGTGKNYWLTSTRLNFEG